MPREKTVRRKFQRQRERQERYGRKAVCRRCHAVMRDIEPDTGYGEFLHPSGRGCKNDGKILSLSPELAKEVEPFLPKSARRAAARVGRRVVE